MKAGILAAAALAFATIGLVSCGEEPAPADTAPDVPEGVTVANARLMLPAVSGNPAAVYFDITNAGTEDRMIRAASVQGASGATLHQMGTWNNQPSMDEVFTVPVKAGETVKFEPGGFHVMANDLADTVVAGGQTDVTVTFVGGDKISFPAEVRAAGDER